MGRSERTPDELDRWIGAVLLPEVRARGAGGASEDLVPTVADLEARRSAGVVAFGRTPRGPAALDVLIGELQQRALDAALPSPFVACDLEEGAGQHFADGTRLPPAGALARVGALDAGAVGDELFWIRSAGALTAKEARRSGVGLVLAPVCDLDLRAESSIVAMRSFGSDPERVAERAGAFLEGLHALGAAGCAKHFPGHGDTTVDTHHALATLAATADELFARELVSFRRAIDAGVEAVMVGHLDVPGLTGEPGLPATLSPRAVRDVLRERLGFGGAILTDAMDMGALASFPSRYPDALAAGCDGLLCPTDPAAAADSIRAAVEAGQLAPERVRDAAARIGALRGRVHARVPGRSDLPLHVCAARGADIDAPREFAEAVSARILRASPDWPAAARGSFRVLEPFPPGLPLEVRGALAALGAPSDAAGDGERVVLPVAAAFGAGAGRYGLGPGDPERILERIGRQERRGRRVELAWFAAPRTLPAGWWERPELPILLAFAPTPPLVAAARAFLSGNGRGARSPRVAAG